VNAAFMASQCKHRAYLHPPSNTEYEVGQDANIVFQVFGITRPGIEPRVPALVTRAQSTVRFRCTCFFELEKYPKYSGQGRNEVRWSPGQEATSAPPCSKLRSFGSQCTVVKKVLLTLLGIFRTPRSGSAPHSDSAPWLLCPFAPPSLRPCSLMPDNGVENKGSSKNRNAVWKPLRLRLYY